MVIKSEFINVLWNAKKYLKNNGKGYIQSKECKDLSDMLQNINDENKKDGVKMFIGNIITIHSEGKDHKVLVPYSVSAVGCYTEFITENTRVFRNPMIPDSVAFRTEIKDYNSRSFNELFDSDAVMWWHISNIGSYNTIGSSVETFVGEAMHHLEMLLKENKLTELKQD